MTSLFNIPSDDAYALKYFVVKSHEFCKQNIFFIAQTSTVTEKKCESLCNSLGHT